MATAYVKNEALSIYSAPDVKAVITKIERNGQTEAYFLTGLTEGFALGILTGEAQDGFLQIEHAFEIRRSLTSTNKWYWLFPPAGIAASQLSQWTKETELIWVFKEDITVDSPEAIATAQKKAQQDKLLSEIDKTLVGAGEPEKPSNNTPLVIAIGGALGVLAGVLWWAFGKKKDNGPVVAQPPVILKLPQSK